MPIVWTLKNKKTAPSNKNHKNEKSKTKEACHSPRSGVQ